MNSKFKSSKIHLLPKTESRKLGRVLSEQGFAPKFPESGAWDVAVDVAAVIEKSRTFSLGFVELKDTKIKLTDVGQILGYSRVCNPEISLLLSPQGLSTDLTRLLKVYGRSDVLEFGKKSIRVGKWDKTRQTPLWEEMIPGGEFRSISTH